MASDKPVTDLQDARVFKRMGIPLTTPVEHREFSHAYSEQWFKLLRAYERFGNAVADQSGKPFPDYEKAVPAHDVLYKQIARAQKAKLADETERALLTWFLENRAVPFADFWDGVFDALERGEAVTLRAEEIPVFLDNERD